MGRNPSGQMAGHEVEQPPRPGGKNSTRTATMTTLFDRFLATSAHRSPGKNSRVLIAEDYADLAAVIALLLRKCGFDVKLAHDGKAVLAIARDFLPHYIILDIRLPGIGGFEVAELIRREERLKGAIIIGVSAFRPVHEPVLEHFDHFLSKPFDLDVLLSLFRPN